MIRKNRKADRTVELNYYILYYIRNIIVKSNSTVSLSVFSVPVFLRFADQLALAKV